MSTLPISKSVFRTIVTVRVCWDSDRLDLARVGTTPDPALLCTPAARDPEVLAWAIERGRRERVPAYVREEWLAG